MELRCAARQVARSVLLVQQEMLGSPIKRYTGEEKRVRSLIALDDDKTHAAGTHTKDNTNKSKRLIVQVQVKPSKSQKYNRFLKKSRSV